MNFCIPLARTPCIYCNTMHGTQNAHNISCADCINILYMLPNGELRF
jgi:hypothetical protein